MNDLKLWNTFNNEMRSCDVNEFKEMINEWIKDNDVTHYSWCILVNIMCCDVLCFTFYLSLICIYIFYFIVRSFRSNFALKY